MNDGERKVEQAIRFSKIWWKSRADAEKITGIYGFRSWSF